MDKRQKQIALIAGGAILLYLVYRWYSSQSASSTAAGTTAPDTSGSDYAALAGQEQSDVAALQGQNSQEATQEASDVSGLAAYIQALGSGLTGTEATVTALQGTVAGLATGTTKAPAASKTATIATHPGGPFYKYYKQVTGKAPPARVSVTSFLYEAWKRGVKATDLQKHNQHPASKNKQVAHPNPGHKQKTQVKPPAPKMGLVGKQKATVSNPATHKTKAKVSGRRR